MRGLYPIIDLCHVTARGHDPLDFARRVLAVRPVLVQLRAKRASAKDTLALLRALRPLCRNAQVPLFANDRPDLAVYAGCDGVHVGQEDLSVGDVRRVAPSLQVGVSTHNRQQLQAALATKPDYVAFGPVFATRSKERPDPVVGLDTLAEAGRLARAVGCPLVAVGGIDLGRASAIAAVGAVGAVIGALLPTGGSLETLTDHARALHRALGGQ